MCCKCCSTKTQKITFFSLTTVLLVLGIVLVAAWRTIANAIIDSSLPLTPTSYTFSQWVETPVPMYTTFYLFNWTNPDEVANPNVKPHFDELGPYVFHDYKIKEDLDWIDVNSTVTFYGRRTWYFDRSLSNGSLDDMVTVPHFPSVAGAKISRSMSKSMRKIMNFTLCREGGALTATHTAIEWIFDGFYDDLLDFVERLHSPKLPIYTNQFGYFYGRNGSKEAEGTYTIHTGKADLSQMGDLKMWNGSDHTGFYDGECGKVNGTTGELWSPHKKWDEAVTIFISDAARYLNLFPQERVNYKGVEGWLYTSTDQTLDNGYVAPDTKCFCVAGRECPKNGVTDYSPAAFNAPLYLSHPHFYMTDPMYLENTTGMKPDPKTDSIYAIVEPTLAVPLKVHGQVMISLLVEQDEAIDLFKDVAHDFYAPMFIIQMTAEITDDILNYARFALSVPDIGQYIGIAFTILGAVLIAIGLWFSCTKRWGDDTETLIEDSKPNTTQSTEQTK